MSNNYKVNHLIEMYGMPIILVQRFAITIQIKPDEFKEEEHDYCFYKNDNLIACISKHDAKLKKVRRPSNLIIECKDCYIVMDSETDDHIAYIYWY